MVLIAALNAARTPGVRFVPVLNDDDDLLVHGRERDAV